MDFCGFFAKKIYRRSLGPWCVKGTEESTSRVDCSVLLTYHDLGDLVLLCLVKKCKICFQILSDLRIQCWIFVKKCTPKCAIYIPKRDDERPHFIHMQVLPWAFNTFEITKQGWMRFKSDLLLKLALCLNLTCLGLIRKWFNLWNLSRLHNTTLEPAELEAL